MPNRLTSPVPIQPGKERLKELLDGLLTRIRRRGNGSHANLLGAIAEAFRQFFTGLAEPTAEKRLLDPTAPKSDDQLNRTFQPIASDVRSLMGSHRDLTGFLGQSFNYTDTLRRSVIGRIKETAGKALDLRLIADPDTLTAIVAGDDFTDEARIDRSRITGTPVDRPPAIDAIMIKRTGGEAVTRPGMRVTVSGPPGLYEGRFYGLPNEVEPEGGQFHLEIVRGKETVQAVQGIPAPLAERYRAYNARLEEIGRLQQAGVIDPGTSVGRPVTPQEGKELARQQGFYGGFTQDEWEILANGYHYETVFVQADPRAQIALQGSGSPQVAAERLIERGAPAEEKDQIRQNILDGDPDSYWQAELTVTVPEGLNPATVNPDTLETEPGLTPQELQTLLSKDYDLTDFRVSVTIDLGGVRPTNWLQVMPQTFSGLSVPEVEGIETSLDGQNFTPVSLGRFERTLVPETNRPITPEEKALTLAGNPFQFSGQGVFPLPDLQASHIRINLIQRVPAPAPYQLHKVQLVSSVVTNIKTTRLFGTKRRSALQYFTQTVTLPYLESLVNTAETIRAKLTTQSSGGEETQLSTAAKIASNPLLHKGPAQILALLDRKLFRNLAGKVFGSRTTKFYDSGWTVGSEYDETRWDKARYAVGLREVAAFSYTYQEQSELVSIPFRSPKTIASISLQVDEKIPESFPSPRRQWMRYYFSLDDGTTWLPIEPLQSRLLPEEAERIPTVYRINSDVPAEQQDPRIGYVDTARDTPLSVRFRAVLRRPAGNTRESPVLQAYRLILTPRDR